MAAAPAAPPASSPPAGVTIVDTGPPKPPPAPTSTIRVSQMPSTATPAAPPKPGSAMDRLKADLAKKVKPETGQTAQRAAAPPKPAVTPKPQAQQTESPPQAPEGDGVNDNPDPGTENPPDPGSTEQPAAEETPAAVDPKAGKPGKTNPWKLVEQYKAKLSEAEKQIADAKTGSLVEQEKTQYLTQIEQLQKRNTELEDEMRFVNYQKSDEFKTKYDQPYQDAWKVAVSELSEIPVRDQESNTVRPATAQDLLALVQLPLGEARDIAEHVFGKFADDVMAHRKTIRNLFDQQAKALEDAKTKGAERDKQRFEMMGKHQREMAEFTEKTWKQANTAALSDAKYGKFFAPVEGDQDGNQRLSKGFELVDRAFNENPHDPSLTPEQRATVIKRHAAVRNRAAAFGRVMLWLEQRDAKIAELEKELNGYKDSTPPAGGGSAPNAPASEPSSGIQSVFTALRKIAK